MSPYRIAFDSSWYPLALKGREAAVTGFSIDFLKELAAKENVDIEQVQTSWNMLFQDLEKGNFDGILSSLDPNKINIEKYNFSKPYLRIGSVLVIPSWSNIKSLKGMQAKIIGILNSTEDEFLAQKIPQIVIRRFDQTGIALEALSAGVIDGVLVPYLEAQAYTDDLYAGVLKIATPPLTDKALRLITLINGPPYLMEAFNEGIDGLKKNSKFKNLLNKWNLRN